MIGLAFDLLDEGRELPGQVGEISSCSTSPLEDWQLARVACGVR